MHIGVDLPATEHHNIVRQEHIQLIHKLLQISDRFTFKMSIEITSVNASVGATASGDRYFLFQFEADAFFEHLLHADIARLNLPAVISFSVVCKM